MPYSPISFQQAATAATSRRGVATRGKKFEKKNGEKIWRFRKNTRKRNIQGKDPRTFEANSQGGVPKTLERNSQGVVSSTSPPWDQGGRMQVRCILQEDRSKKDTRWWRCGDPQIHQTARLGLPQWCDQQSRKPRSILFSRGPPYISLQRLESKCISGFLSWANSGCCVPRSYTAGVTHRQV